MRHPQTPEGKPWFWTITREIRRQFTVEDIQRPENR
jgi:hypothetical protein